VIQNSGDIEPIFGSDGDMFYVTRSTVTRTKIIATYLEKTRQ
jgi:hypothetical protein